jgi:hypothetical protein
MEPRQVVEWLYANASPIIRYRMERDWGYPAPDSIAVLLAQVLKLPETQRWLANLGGPQIHSSRDTAAENAAAKLIEYGLHAGVSALDAKMLFYATG